MELYHLYPVLQLKKADPSALSTRGNHSAEHYDETDGFPNGGRSLRVGALTPFQMTSRSPWWLNSVSNNITEPLVA